MRQNAAAAMILFVFSSGIFAAPIIYQAEDGVFNGTNVSTASPGYQGTGFVTGFDTAGDYCQVTVTAPSAGIYNITLGYAVPAGWGDKVNDLYANGVLQSSVTFTNSASAFTSVNAGLVPLNAGSNTLRVQNNWGYIYLDWFGVEAAVLPPLSVPDTLVNTASSAATKCLMSYLVNNYGDYTISGQSNTPNAQWIYNNTGKYPALCGFDMMDYSPSRVERGVGDPMEVEKAIAWYQAGGIVQFQWHWNAPMHLIDTVDHEWWRGFYTHATTYDIAYALANTGSAEYTALIRDIDAIAVQLERLQAAGVPVLWRPLHEAQGAWFWWGAKGSTACKQLYWLVFDRLKNYHGINNLIWVWTTQDNAEAVNWYPGHSYVDAVGADIYLSGLNYSPSTGMFYNIVNLVGGQKLVAMTENGTIPDADDMVSQDAHWSWFMTWNGFEQDTAQNSLAHVQAVYGHSYILTRDELTGVFVCGPSPTLTATGTATLSFSPTLTLTSNLSPSFTATHSPTNTRTGTPDYTSTETITGTPPTATATPSITSTGSRVPSASVTPTSTESQVPSFESTFTVTPAYTPTCTPAAGAGPLLYGNVYAYPNPATAGEGFSVHFTVRRDCSKALFSLYTYSFRLVRRIEYAVYYPAGDNVFSIRDEDMDGLAAGLYFYSFTVENGETEKAKSRVETLVVLP